MPLDSSSGEKARSKLAKKIFVVIRVMLVAGLVWIGWEFQPWMPEGRAVRLGNARLGDHDFQIWQRKNGLIDATEPFATALFVHKTGGPWTAYLLDIQDTYRPSIDLREESSGVAVFYGKTRRAYFDEQRDVLTLYHYDGGSDVIDGVAIDSEPPDDWWHRRLSILR
jgi:hypothetical protein